MRERLGNVIWGISLVILGVLWGLDAVNIIDVTLFFRGWWTLFIIIPSTVDMIQKGLKVSNVTSLIVGVMLYFASIDVLTWDIIWKLTLPIIIVYAGFSIIFKGTKNRPNIKTEGYKGEYSAIFSGQKEDFINQEFTGATADAVFGGVELNLKGAIIKEDVEIKISAIFGGVDIIVPANVNVKVNNTGIFGGVDNKVKNDTTEGIKTIYINSFCLFGGVDIK